MTSNAFWWQYISYLMNKTEIDLRSEKLGWYFYLTLREKARSFTEAMWGNVGIKHLLFVLLPCDFTD